VASTASTFYDITIEEYSDIKISLEEDRKDRGWLRYLGDMGDKLKNISDVHGYEFTFDIKPKKNNLSK
jgi:hypothetical protein